MKVNMMSGIAKKIALAAAISSMVSMGGIAYAMPGFVQGAAMEQKASKDPKYEFCGFWEEDLKGDIRLTVTPAEEGWFGVEVSWRRNSKQVDMWTMTAKPIGNHTMQYTDCRHYLLTYGPKYLDKEELLYEGGTGSLRMVGTERIAWQDDQEHRADGLSFVPLRSPLGGGL